MFPFRPRLLLQSFGERIQNDVRLPFEPIQIEDAFSKLAMVQN